MDALFYLAGLLFGCLSLAGLVARVNPAPVAPPAPPPVPPAEDLEAKLAQLPDKAAVLQQAFAALSEKHPFLAELALAPAPPAPPSSERNERIFKAVREQLPDVSNARVDLWPENTAEALVLDIAVVRGWRVEPITADEWERLRTAGAPLMPYADKARLCVSLRGEEAALHVQRARA